MTASSSLKTLVCSSLAVITVAIVLTTTFVFTIERLGWSADPLLVSLKINNAINTGASSFPAEWAQNTTTGVDTFTDCLTIEISTHKSRKFQDSLVSAIYEPGKSEHSCVGLTERINPSQVGAPEVDYWRYWWGSSSLLASVLNVDSLTLQGYQSLLKSLTYFALILVGFIVLIRFRIKGIIIIPMILSLLFGYGIPIFGQSVAHAPGLLLGLVFCIIYISGKSLHSSLWRRATCAAILGGISFYFDLLNGNLVALLMLFLIINVIFIRQLQPSFRCPMIIEIIILVSVYVFGAFYVLLLRCVLRALVFNLRTIDVISEWIRALSMRTRNSVPDYNESYIDTAFIVRRLYYKFDYAFTPYFNTTEVALIYSAGVLTFLMCAIWITMRLWSVGEIPSGPVLSILLISSIVPAWFLILANHTAVHSWMTGRLLSPFFSLSVILLLILIDEKLTRRLSMKEHSRKS